MASITIKVLSFLLPYSLRDDSGVPNNLGREAGKFLEN